MKIKKMIVFLIVLFFSTVPAFAQEHLSTNDIMIKMKNDLNLSDDQVAKITQIVDRYVDASNDLENSIKDGTMNQSEIESQKQQIKDAEEQGVAQYLRSDQLYQWRQIESQMDQQKGNDNSDQGDNASDSGQYSNLPQNTPSQ